MLTMSGWVIYRFRSTRCLTLAEFFEKGIVENLGFSQGLLRSLLGLLILEYFRCWHAQFFISYCGLPDTFAGIPMYPLIMIILLSISLYFVYTGGQIAVIIADFFKAYLQPWCLLLLRFHLFFYSRLGAGNLFLRTDSYKSS